MAESLPNQTALLKALVKGKKLVNPPPERSRPQFTKSS